MNEEPGFRYSDAQWAKLVQIVTNAGGDTAIFERYRPFLEARIVGYRDAVTGFATWDSRQAFEDRVRAVKGAQALVDYLDRSGWSTWPTDGPLSTERGRTDFRDAIGFFASLRISAERELPNVFWRDLLWRSLIEFWHDVLNLPIGTGVPSHVVRFIKEACHGTLGPSVKSTDNAVQGVVRKEKKRIEAIDVEIPRGR